MFIQTERRRTRRPSSSCPASAVMAGGTAEFTDAEAAGRASPLASRLFGVEG